MRIGILTFHRAINYGAVMQAFSLQTRLQKEFPNCEVEIIDYNSSTREWFKVKCPLVFSYRRSIKEAIQKATQTCAFNSALKRLRLSKSLLGATDQKVNQYMSENYDIVIVGSDAVFNWNDIGLPNPYFLGEVHGPRKLSYAASSHLQRYNDISQEQKEYLQQALADFTYIGVRDRSSEEFVNNLLGEKKAEHNCDPTIFLDMQFDSMQLEKKLKKHGFDFNKKTVFVMLMKPEFAEYARKYFGEDCQIVALMDGNKCADIYLHDLNPFEWAKVFSYGSFLVTDYFHGTIMGLKNNIPVLSIDSSGYGTTGEYESKACDLLKTRLGLPELYITADELRKDNGYRVFQERIRVIENTFSADILNQRIAKEAESYQSFCAVLKETCKK